MFLYRLSFFMVLLGDYVYTGNIYLNNQCSHFLGKIFICKRATDDKVFSLLPIFVQDINRRRQNSYEEQTSVLPNPWISLLTRNFRLQWTNQKEH
ncbi:hypothetical protein ACH3XW_37005 [Acanthocheilonema viteae]